MAASANRLLDHRGQQVASVSPFKEAGVSGTAVFGGFIVNRERSSKLYGDERYRTASELLANISIVAAGVRYFLNLLAKPAWKVDADDSGEADESSEFLQEVMDDMETAWSRMVRRAGLYRFHGFGIQEWTAKKRKDGKIGYADVESRPQHTITRWAVDEKGTVTGVWQRNPQNGQEIGLPRSKIIYLVDDTLTDSPEGMGWFRHLVEPSERLKTYLQLEGYGFQRDLSGTPIGRAPLTKIAEMVKQNKITQAQADKMTQGLEDFCKLQAKKPDTGLMLDSQTYESLTADGWQSGSVPHWDLNLLTGQISSLDTVAQALSRITYDMARVIGVEHMLLGSDGSGSLALSKDKSHNMYLQVDSTLRDMAAQFSKDYIDPIWMLNGLNDDVKPKLVTEEVAFKDIEQITAALRDMSTAGAVLQPDDPAINEIRDIMGLSHQPDIDPETLGMMRDRAMGILPGMEEPGMEGLDEDGNPIEEDPDEDMPDKKPPPKKPGGRPFGKGHGPFDKAFNPDQPRDEDGKWGEGGGGSSGGSDAGGGGDLQGNSDEPFPDDDDPTQGGDENPMDRILGDAPRAGTVAHLESNLAPGERTALEGYQSDSYADINRYLTGRLKPGESPPEDYLNHEIKMLDSAIDRSKTVGDMVVYRGGNGWQSHDWEKQVGKEIEYKSYMSTSMNEELASGFASDDAGGTNYTIFVPKGSKALWMNDAVHRSNIDERELLLPRNSKFRVVKVDPVTRDVSLELQ